nr:claspin [Nomia melanderi]
MNKIDDLNDTKTNNEPNTENICLEIESSKEVDDCLKIGLNKPIEINNDCISNVTDVFNKTVQETNKESIQESEEFQVAKSLKKLSRIIDSDSEDDSIFISKTERENDVNKFSNQHTYKKNIVRCLDSDTDDETFVVQKNDNANKISNEGKVQNGFRSLIDSESEEDDEMQSSPVKNEDYKQQKEHIEPVKRKVSLRASKEEAMKQIHSETQRLIRETEISLPYHKPKQRTLQEFLNRKKVLSVLPKASSMAAKLKMSSAIVDKVLKEKEKEAEIFYKSSDSEEEAIENHSEVDKENAITEYTENFKKVPETLLIHDNLSVDNKENNISMTHKVNENVMETNGTNSNLAIEVDTMQVDNTNDLEILKSNCNTIGTENENENISKSIKTVETSHKQDKDNTLQQKLIENKNRDNILQTVSDSLKTSNSNTTDDYAKMVKQSLGITAEEVDEYNEYGLPPPKFDISPNINKKKTLFDIQSLKPKLRGLPGTVIDLSDDVKPNKKGINAFIDRFVHRHSKMKDEVDDTQIIESPDGVSTKTKETISHKPLNFKKPGLKLLRLKQELKEKMALKREEEWKEKEQEMKEQEIEWNETVKEDDNFSKVYSPDIVTYESEEDELEENDIIEKKEKKTRKCAFVDDEADVTDDEINDEDEIIDDDEEENVEKDEEECERLILEDDESSTCDSADIQRKPFKRIIEPIEDDSRSCDTLNNDDIANKEKNICSNVSNGTSRHVSDMFCESVSENERCSDNEQDIPVSQAHVESDLERKPYQTPLTKTNNFSFVSPITQLTALNTRLEEKEMVPTEREFLVDESGPILMESPQIELSQEMHNSKSRPPMHKKLLFTDQNDATEEDLIELCSGKFTTNKTDLDLSKSSDITESQLLELCSGTFGTRTNNTESSMKDFPSKELQETSIKGSITSESNANYERSKRNDEFKENSDVLHFAEKEDEDLIEREVNSRSKRKVKKLELSDDEEENNCSMSNDDDEQNESDDENEGDQEKFIDYDSEENEVVVPRKNIKQYAATFLENEAELSESDCDVSADEDEKDMDKLEVEEGDDEEIDEAQMKNQLDRLHMRQILDEDQKEVRLLKELLFEEGDLYSESGRERKFKWKNINKQDDNDQFQPSEDKDGWVDLSDEEDEAKWRQIRHEREKFLAEKMVNIDTEIENDLNDSQIFKFGMKILKKRRINESQVENTMLDSTDSKMEPRISHTIAEMLNSTGSEGKSCVIRNAIQKHSILAKGEKSLARFAALTKQKDVSLPSINAKNFVFTRVDSLVENVSEDPVLKTKNQRYKAKRKT